MIDRSQPLRLDALSIFHAALRAAGAGNAVRRHLLCSDTHLQAGDLPLPLASFDRIHVLGVGKASVEMANAMEDVLGERLTDGLVVTKHGHHTTCLQRLRVVETGHPIPDDAGLRAAAEVVRLVSGMGARDLLLVALSGGASSLLPAPAPGITLADKGRTTDLLLRCGASIGEINTVRKHLSTLKGGQLAKLAAPATVLTLIVSDVVGSPHDAIGSGITAPDPTTFADAMCVLTRYALLAKVPASVRLRLEAGARGALPETPKPGDPLFGRTHVHVIASNQLALEAAHAEAVARGYHARILSSTLVGETREVAAAQVQALREVLRAGTPVRRPACLLAGGETTVTVRGDGTGGRNTEFTLAAALAIADLADVLVLSAGTDGADGPTDAAGATATGDTLRRAKDLGLDPLEYTFFGALGDLIKTGPTGTNVMDIQVMLAG